MTANQKTLLICCIAFVTTVLLFLGSCGAYFYYSVKKFPHYAKNEQVFANHQDVIQQIHQLISTSTSVAEIEQKIASAHWPQKTLYIQLSENHHNTDALKRVSWSGHSTFIFNGSGYGHLITPNGKINIVIIEQTHPNAQGIPINYLIYLSHPPQ